MPIVQCPITNCNYATPDVEAVIAAALISTHATSHTNSSAIKAPVEKIRRHTISLSGTSEDWSYFLSRWEDYKAATKLQRAECITQLLECCEEQLRRDLTRSAGGKLSNKTEAELLAAMKCLAVREENLMVARLNLHNMRQDRDEPVRSFSARLRGQANVCKYLIKCSSCSHDVSYANIMLRDALIRGLNDEEIMLGILSEQNQEMTLEQVLQFVEAKEAGKRSATQLTFQPGTQITHTDAASSSYQREKRDNIKHSNQEPCCYCGRNGHGCSAPSHVRQKQCPAFNHKCSNCHKPHHMESVCRSKKKSSECEAVVDHNAAFDTICTLKMFPDSVQHHIYDKAVSKWKAQPSRAQPKLCVEASINPTDFLHFGCQPTFQTMSILV